MSFSRKAGADLVRAYDHSLERQIVEQGSSLPCRDEELWKKVEGLLRDGRAQEMHCLGLDPLNVMEESLKTVTAAGCSRQVRTGGGLRGLAKAFEVLEQAAVNLYLGPWRKEYSVIQMYSGTFTHCIVPVLSMPQIENLFGLLGYQLSASSELLQLQSHAVSPTSADDLLRLSCAAFLARCECHLLTSALGKHSGDAQWELSAVMERQRGNSLQVAVDNTRKMLEVSEPQIDGDLDLYCDEEANGGEQQVVVSNDESPLWGAQSSASPTAVKKHSNGSSSPLRESHASRSSSDSKMPGRRSRGEKRLEEASSDPPSLQLEPGDAREDEDVSLCSCAHGADVCSSCTDCNTLHSVTCAALQVCKGKGHIVKAVAAQSGGLRSPGLSSGSVAVRSLPLNQDPASITPPPRAISYHDCCDLTKLDPQVLCRTCRVFHSKPCRESTSCRSDHDSSVLGQCCLCQKWCSRKPLVLCRYCGSEYCNSCWYRNPVTCSCGQTFDQSSSV